MSHDALFLVGMLAFVVTPAKAGVQERCVRVDGFRIKCGMTEKGGSLWIQCRAKMTDEGTLLICHPGESRGPVTFVYNTLCRKKVIYIFLPVAGTGLCM